MYHNVLLMIKWQRMWETNKILLGIWSLVCLSDFPSYATFHNKDTVINPYPTNVENRVSS